MYPVPFSSYAVLGDDVVISDSKVASEYYNLLNRLGVSISRGKSLISSNGSFEFAKRFWVKSLQRDVSPISLRILIGCRSTVGLCRS